MTYTPECTCGCTTNLEHVTRWPDLTPRGDDLPDPAPTGEPGGDQARWTP